MIADKSHWHTADSPLGSGSKVLKRIVCKHNVIFLQPNGLGLEGQVCGPIGDLFQSITGDICVLLRQDDSA